MDERPRVAIIIQPASKALRFRYECEGKTRGVLLGINSTRYERTFPTIKISNYAGPAIVLVSCVTNDEPHKPHPYNLVGNGCNQGICVKEISPGENIIIFDNLCIQCIKRTTIQEELRRREELRVDPFRTGFGYKEQLMDLNILRLCFQVFIEGSQKGKFNVPLPPVVSTSIYDKKTLSELVIHKLSHDSASVAGGLEIILLCEEVTKEDIKVRFFEDKDGCLHWQGYGDFELRNVYRKVAICFKTPSYYMQDVMEPVEMHIQLIRPSDGATSEPLPFKMLPRDKNTSKRQRHNSNMNQPVHTPDITEIEKCVEDQPLINIESGSLVSPSGNEDTGSLLALQPVKKRLCNDVPRSSSGPQVPQEPQISPFAWLQQHSMQHQPIMQQQLIRENAQASSYEEVDQTQLHQAETNPYIINEITQDCKDITDIMKQSEILEHYLKVNDTKRNNIQLLDLDTRQLNFEWNPLKPTDVTDLDLLSLSANLSSDLCLSDYI